MSWACFGLKAWSLDDPDLVHKGISSIKVDGESSSVIGAETSVDS